ncbi:MAG: penicillin-binding transpeptidase domain-containing protein, partial [Chloroflexota bacterium]
HVLGYVGKISSSELIANTSEADAIPAYEQDDYIGKDGLELVLEPVLKGQRGKQIVELDSSGNRWRVSPNARIDPQPGQNVRLSIDLELQRATAEILRGGIQYSNDDRKYIETLDPNRKVKKFSGAGAVVAIDPRTGEVLAMVSFPLYDNQLFVDGISQRKYQEYTSEDANKPLIDRALRGEYPPGSTLKPFIAAAGLQEKHITPDKTYTCTGAIKVPWAWDQSKGNTHQCWICRNGCHEALDDYGAIERSCDVFFYNVGAPRQPLDENKTDYLHYRDEYLLLPPDQQLGEKHYFDGLGIKAIKRNLTEGFQFGTPTGIDLPAEAAGVAPDDEWLARTYQGAGWSLGDTINVSIGQGYFLTTPLQLALNTAALANGGKLLKPLLVREVVPSDGGPGEQREPEIIREIGILPEWITVVREGMLRVVHGDWGTARLNVDGSSKWDKTNPTTSDGPVDEILIGGKTGTAELGVPDENGIYERQHSWFTCFAPFDDPEIAISVIIEDGGEGSAYAVPVADRVLRAWFEINGRRERGLVLQPESDLTRPDQSLLAPGAAFPIPGSYATPGVQVQD